MSRQYVKMESLREEVFRRKAEGETNREIAESYGLTKHQIKQLVSRQNRKVRLIANGYVPPLPKGRPCENLKNEEQLLWKKVLSAVACVLLACSIALGGLQDIAVIQK